jgi:hypothetical protein
MYRRGRGLVDDDTRCEDQEKDQHLDEDGRPSRPMARRKGRLLDTTGALGPLVGDFHRGSLSSRCDYGELFPGRTILDRGHPVSTDRLTRPPSAAR